MRGGKRIPGDGKVLGRPQGSVKEESYDDQMSFRCWKDMKKMVSEGAKQAGHAGHLERSPRAREVSGVAESLRFGR